MDDPTSPTGVRLSVDPARAPWVDDAPALLAEAMTNLADLSGFGTLGGIMVRFDGPVTDLPASAEESVTGSGWMLVDLETEPPSRVPFEVQLLDEGETALLWPLRPMRLHTEHALVVTTAAAADDGGCIAPAEATRALLHGQPEDAVLAEHADRYRAAVSALDLRPDDVSVLSVFTTHDDGDVFRRVAADEVAQPVAWVDKLGCAPRGDLLECELVTTVRDRRDETGLLSETAPAVEAEIPVTVWMPTEPGPHPVVVYGHGLGSERSEGWRVAREMWDTPYVVVAMEAVAHGDHPTADPEGGRENALDFLGIDLSSLSIQPRVIRGNFDQTALDRLRLIRLLRQDPDLDGDGVADIDPDQLGYLGISLGAILGPQLLSMDGEIDGAVLSVGGARLMSIVTEAEAVSEFEDIIIALVGSRERFDRLVAVAQHIVDPVDPGTGAAHVLVDRYDDAPAPNVLVQVGMDDEVVPPASGHALARALGAPHLQPVVEEVPLLEVVEGPVVAGNLPDGSTAAFFQFDRVTVDGSVRSAAHVATPSSDEGVLQVQTFLSSWIEDGTAAVINPYAGLE